MLIYFTASTKDIVQKKEEYKRILAIIESLGHKNSNYVHDYANTDLTKNAEKQLKKQNVYDYQLGLIDKSDLLLADINSQSVTIGYQINYALNKKIPVIAIHRKESNHIPPVVLTSDHKGLFTMIEYSSDSDLESKLMEVFKTIRTGSFKFNFYIDLSHYNFLERESIKRGMPKSKVLRYIIQGYIDSVAATNE